ncbi:hypothetical protein [Arcticibacterium luteifluviistationis]|uniref:Uncharacterized protein n=1 Tax=Arcticibacterium luteifluviistationis TaxID=1784714 RepID=A0A2Z4GBR8_9BACT|nr:hypothetical protein [Arcticibacterium luteifluviistationis]AWV98742.1 hypothetical protein DJ013_11385 [Arcticibacterium luteifluviistationis]
MKNLLASIIILLGITFQSNAAEHVDNPHFQIMEVIRTYQTDAGKFQHITKAEQSEFYRAAGMMKNSLATHSDFISEARYKEIDTAEKVFRFIWESKPEYVEIELTKAPELI